MNLNPNQFVSPESDRAEAARGCSKCGQKGHNSRTCGQQDKPKAEAAHESPKTSSLAPAGSMRLGRVDTLRDVCIYLPGSWDTKTTVNFNESHPRNKGKWQIWRAPDGWVYVWHDDVRRVTLIGPSNVCFCELFEG